MSDILINGLLHAGVTRYPVKKSVINSMHALMLRQILFTHTCFQQLSQHHVPVLHPPSALFPRLQLLSKRK